jgi:hypothetical protein
MSRSPEQSEGEESPCSQRQEECVITVSQSPEHSEGEAWQSIVWGVGAWDLAFLVLITDYLHTKKLTGGAGINRLRR